MDVSMEKHVFSTRLIRANGNVVQPPTVPEHTILVAHLKNNEDWIVDAAGAHFGFKDTLTSYEEYFKKTECRDLGKSQPYDVIETKDMGHFLTLPFMAQFRNELILERNARLHFAAFVKAKIDQSHFSKNMLSGTADDFELKAGTLIEELKVYVSEFVVGTYTIQKIT